MMFFMGLFLCVPIKGSVSSEKDTDDFIIYYVIVAVWVGFTGDFLNWFGTKIKSKLYNQFVLGIFFFEEIIRLETIRELNFDFKVENRLTEPFKSHDAYKDEVVWKKLDESSYETTAVINGKKVIINSNSDNIHIKSEHTVKDWLARLLVLSFFCFLVGDIMKINKPYIVVVYLLIYFLVYLNCKRNLSLKWQRIIGFIQGVIGKDTSTYLH
jgi:hypothetical protein